jgi:hypothetical protein
VLATDVSRPPFSYFLLKTTTDKEKIVNQILNPHIEYINLMLEEKREEATRARQAREARQRRRRPRRLARNRSRLRPAVT